MKKLFFLSLLFFWQLTVVFSADVAELRKLYYEAAGERRSADKFMKVMESLPVDSDPLLLSYKGMAHLIQANFSYNPYNKLSYFAKGKEMLENAISADPKNIEIRFMRFCVQTNAPFFLGYSDAISADRTFILQYWNTTADADLKERIKKYMIEFGKCSPKEKSLFQ